MIKSFKEIWKNYMVLFKEAFTDLRTKGRRHRQIPNILTATRLIAAPCFIIPAAISGNVFLIALFSVIFSLTDALDGFIARKYKLVSELGKDLDATSDKVFASSLLIAESFFTPAIIFNLIFEIIIAGINVREKFRGSTPRSLYVGKIKTCVLYPLIIVGFLTPYFNITNLFNTLLVAATSMQMLTVASYILRYEKDSVECIENNNSKKIDLEESQEESSKSKVSSKKKTIINRSKVKENVEIMGNREENKESITAMKGLFEFELDYNKKVEEKQKVKMKTKKRE